MGNLSLPQEKCYLLLQHLSKWRGLKSWHSYPEISFEVLWIGREVSLKVLRDCWAARLLWFIWPVCHLKVLRLIIPHTFLWRPLSTAITIQKLMLETRGRFCLLEHTSMSWSGKCKTVHWTCSLNPLKQVRSKTGTNSLDIIIVYNGDTSLLLSRWFEGQVMRSVQICSPECISASCDIFLRRSLL